MTAGRRSVITTLVLALLAGIGGALIGIQVSRGRTHDDGALHSLLHDRLDLTAAQDQRIVSEEASFRTRRFALEKRIREANAGLARAIRASKRDGPEVQAAIDQVHAALGEYQKETVSHIFRMRSLLTPDQAKKFDQGVADALTKHDR